MANMLDVNIRNGSKSHNIITTPTMEKCSFTVTKTFTQYFCVQEYLFQDSTLSLRTLTTAGDGTWMLATDRGQM